MTAWRIVSPAPRVAALALAGAGARTRKAVLFQVRTVETAAVYRGDEVMAVVHLDRHGWRRIEMALQISPAAPPHLRRLVRMAQLTLGRIAETSIVVATVHPANLAGQRMATMVGFRPARPPASRGLWVFRRDASHGCDPRRRQRQQESGRGGPQATADRG